MSTHGSSPVVPSSPVSSDQLVCHRVKDCCVQLHGSVQRWKQLSDKGFDIANKLVNSLLQHKYVSMCLVHLSYSTVISLYWVVKVV